MILEKIAYDLLVGVYSGLVTSVIQSTSDEVERRKASEPESALRTYEASRPISQKLADHIAAVCRKLPADKGKVIAQFLRSELTVAALTELVKNGAFEKEPIGAVLRADGASQVLSDSVVLDLSIALQNTFEECIATDEVASHYTILRQMRQVRVETSEVRASVGRTDQTIHETVVPGIAKLGEQLDALIKRTIPAPSAPPTTASASDSFAHNTPRHLSFEALAERLESQYSARFQGATDNLNLGQTSAALTQFHVLFKEVDGFDDPSSQKVRFRSANGIALCHWYELRNEESKTWFEKANAAGGDEKIVRRNRMLIRLLEGDKSSARTLAEALLLDYPHMFDGALVLANLALAEEKPEEAVRIFETHSDGSLNYQLSLSSQYLKLGRFDAAKKCAEQALELAPESRDARVALVDAKALPIVIHRNEIQSDQSITKAEKQTLEEALPIYADALSESRRPQILDIWQRLVVNYSSFASILGHLDEAEAVLRPFLQAHPHSIDVLRNAFIVSVKEKNFDRATAQAELLFKLEPCFENAARLLETLTQAQRNSQALDAYARLLPDYPEVGQLVER